MISSLLASITRIILFKIWADILEELWLSNALPVLVIHTFVAFEVALPSAIWTGTGSSGSFSFDQKYTIYGPILKICGTQNSSLL